VRYGAWRSKGFEVRAWASTSWSSNGESSRWASWLGEAVYDIVASVSSVSQEAISPSVQLTASDIPAIDWAAQATSIQARRDEKVAEYATCDTARGAAKDLRSEPGPDGWYKVAGGSGGCTVLSRERQEKATVGSNLDTTGNGTTTVQRTVVTFRVRGVTVEEFCRYFNSHHLWDSSIDGPARCIDSSPEELGMNVRYSYSFPFVRGTYPRDACQITRFEMMPDGRVYFHSSSVDHKAVPQAETTNKFVRGLLTVDALVTPVVLGQGSDPRAGIAVDVHYEIDVNPGGIVPLTIFRAVATRLFPRTFDALSSGCTSYFEGKPLLPPREHAGPWIVKALDA